MTGQDQLERLDIDHEAASSVGLSGGVSLDVHATRVRAAYPMFGSALRYLDSGAAISASLDEEDRASNASQDTTVTSSR